MNAPPVEPTATQTFVVRFWREWSGAESRWRGRVEHVQSEQGAAFTDMKQMADFLRKFVDMASGCEENAPIRSERRRS